MYKEISQSETIKIFDENITLLKLKHFLPEQSPLKDFIHHNTLHAFQGKHFYPAIQQASAIFGYKVTIPLHDFRERYHKGLINHDVFSRIIIDTKGQEHFEIWKNKLLESEYSDSEIPRLGTLRATWKSEFFIDLDLAVQPILFRILCSYLDQGISIWRFPVWNMGFLESIKEIEKNTFNSIFKSERVRKLLLDPLNSEHKCTLDNLLNLLVGDESLYEQYLFDVLFSHPGWSGMVSTIEDKPETLIDTRLISLKDLIIFELLLEIDALDSKFGESWLPLISRMKLKPVGLFDNVADTEFNEVIRLWQDIFEWSYYDQVLAGIGMEDVKSKGTYEKSFQAMFCIDDREISLRRYLEQFDQNCETFATPGFFGVEFFFQPEHGKSYTKQCPAPVTPKHLIKEIGTKDKRESDVHFAKHTHSLFTGFIISQTLGFWSAFRLFLQIFRPTLSPATASSFRHMDKISNLSILNINKDDTENELQVGFTVEEMINRVEALLMSIGMNKDFAPVIYIVGHGSSSVNNPHYAAYDCGACSGRPGSVNARVMSYMANHPEVRAGLRTRGIDIPDETQFIGALHDTTRDEIEYYDDHTLSDRNRYAHIEYEKTFIKALDYNSKERSRRFESINTRLSPEMIHVKIRRRSVSLFEPRPELNHATNAICIVGRRNLSMDLFLDRRAFANSYDYLVDPEGNYLLNILKAAAPVCGGINLEYYFSRVDNHRLGAGTKLPHNIMGLFGVANGIDGDLRPGLPKQMIEAHDPIRLLVVVEHFPEIVLRTILKSEATYIWFLNEWVHLVVVNPVTKELFRFREGAFMVYQPAIENVQVVKDLTPLIESHQENFPVYLIDRS